MTIINELKEKRAERIHHWDGRQAQITEHQEALRNIEADIADLDTAIAALEPARPSIDHTEPESGLRAAEDVWTPEGLEQLSAKADAFIAHIGAPQIEPEPSLFDDINFDDEDDAPAEFISDLTGDPAIEPESGLHGEPVELDEVLEANPDTITLSDDYKDDPEPTELDAEPASVLDNPELLAAVERAEATLAARVWTQEDLERLPQIEPEPAAYVGLNDPELDDAWDAMKAREEAEKPKPRFSIWGPRKLEDA